MAVSEAVGWRQQQERERDVWLAWHIAALSRMDKLPPLDRLLRPPMTQTFSADEKARCAHEHAELVERMGKRNAKGH